MLLQGIFPPITTPFYPDGNVYFKKIESNVERYSRTPVAGIVVLGSTGESIMLSDQERRDVFKAARQSAAPEKVLIAGTGIESAVETLRLTEHAATLGYDLAMIRTPHFYRKQMQPANLLAFYRTVADSSALPVLIYNVPPFTAYDMPAELIIELAEHSNIVGMKESSGDVNQLAEIAARVPGSFSVYSGDDHLALPSAALGGCGVVSVISHVAGNDLAKMFAAFDRGDTDAASAIHHSLMPLFKALFAVTSPIPVKAAMRAFGFAAGACRLPLCPLTAEQERALRTALIPWLPAAVGATAR